MCKIINFDDKCREADVNKYTEIVHRRSTLRMEKMTAEHNKQLKSIVYRGPVSSIIISTVCIAAFIILLALSAKYIIG